MLEGAEDEAVMQRQRVAASQVAAWIERQVTAMGATTTPDGRHALELHLKDVAIQADRDHEFVVHYCSAAHETCLAPRARERIGRFWSALDASAASLMSDAGLAPRLLVDCSHANSGKDPQRQPHVIDSVCEQIVGGERRLMGVMIESHLVGGRQDIVPGQALTYGQSITDSCIAWDETAPLIAQLAEAVRRRRSGTAN